MSAIYDQIGDSYSQTRSSDPRILERIVELLDLPAGAKILDVGAGTGSYSRPLAEKDFCVTALEPSQVMREQSRDRDSVTWVDGTAENLPFDDGSFDGAILILCIHHFTDTGTALKKIRRVTESGPILIFTYDPGALEKPWLFQYFPIFKSQIGDSFPSIRKIQKELPPGNEIASIPFPLPHDLTDEFAGAAWRYPERYLEKDFRNGTSAFRQLDPDVAVDGLTKLTADLESGEWDSRHGEVRKLDVYDHGYIFILIKKHDSHYLQSGSTDPASTNHSGTTPTQV